MTATAAHKSSMAAGAAEDVTVDRGPGGKDLAHLYGKSDHPDPDKLDLLEIQHGKEYKQYDYKEYDADLMKYLQ